ncbi:MAG: metallophosphoesterase family protein [Chloroflexi bacterium]|nr:metallophosphoesterase family protein [Chloroflexota bacterium]
MKIALLADVHANQRALWAVYEDIERWRPDHVLVLGDVVNRGPRPHECLAFVQQRVADAGWRCVIGNHEEYVLREFRQPDKASPLRETFRASQWTGACLGEAGIAAIEQWPFSLALNFELSGEVRVAHASMLHTRDGIFTETTHKEIRGKVGAPLPAVFGVGHTHVPLQRTLAPEQALVVNAGSVGMPFDGDPRAAYAQLEWRHGRWSARIMRVEYDRAGAVHDFAESGFLRDGGAHATVMLWELRLSRGLLFEWARDFEAAVLGGEMSMQRSVELFLRERGLGE